MRKKLFSLAVMLVALLCMPMAVNAETLLVNDGTNTNSYVPIYGSYTDSYMNSQVVYPESALTAMVGKNITMLTFYHSKTSDFAFTGTFDVSLGIRSDATFPDRTSDQTTARTNVYNGLLTVKSDGTLIIEFQSDYLYQGGNLLLDIRMAVSGNYSSVSFYGLSNQTGYSVYTSNYTAETPSYSNANFAPKTTFTYETPSNCPKPSGITLGTVTTNSAAITWTENGTATAWRIYYSINGGLMDSADVTGTPAYTITGLSHSASYTVSGYVKANCGSEMSNQRNFSFSFDTECATPSTPTFFQDFEGAKFPPVCWSMTHVSGTSTADPYAINTTSTSYIHSGSQSVRPCNAMNNEQILATGVLPIDQANKYEVVMWIYRKASNTTASQDDEGLKIYASSSPTDTAGATLLGYVHGSCNRTPVETKAGYYKYNFPITTSGNKYLLIYSITRSSSPTYFDDLQVRKIPTCLDIQGLQTISDITTTTASVAVHDNTVTAFDVAYGVQGTPIEECQIASFNDTIGTLTGLTPSLFYDTYIRRNCGTDTGEWTTDKVTFRTLCVPVAELPFTEDFEGEPTGNIGGCYTVNHLNTTSSYYYSVITNSNNHTEGGTKVAAVAYLTTSAPYVMGTFGFYRQFELDATKAYKISAWAKSAGTDAFDLIFLCDTVIDETMQEMSSVKVSGTTYGQHVGYISVPTTGTYYIGIRTRDYGATVCAYIDDIRIEETICIPPIGVSVSNIADHSAVVTYSAKAGNTVEMAFGTTEENMFDSIFTVASSPYTLSNLDQHQTYYFAMRSIVGTDTSDWTTAASFTTLCEPVHANELPMFDDFEGEPAGTLYGCYTSGVISDYGYVIANLEQPYANHTEGGSKGLCSASSTGSRTNITWKSYLYRQFDLVAGQSYAISLWSKVYDSPTDYSFDLSFAFGTDAVDSAMTVCGTSRVLGFDWKEYKGFFTAPTTGTYYVGVQAYNNGKSYYFYGDDFGVYTVAVIPPSASSVSDITATTANINFTSSATQFEVSVDTIAENVEAGTVYNNKNVTASPVAITGLQDNTQYYYAIRTISGNDTSEWIYGDFMTICFPVSELPFLDDFDSYPKEKDLAGCYTTFAPTEDDDLFSIEGKRHPQSETDLDLMIGSGTSQIRNSEGYYGLMRQFTLRAGTYYVAMDAYSDPDRLGQNFAYNMDFFYSTDGENLTVFDTKRVDYQGDYRTTKGYVTIPADGTYYLGVKVKEAGNSAYIFLDNFAVDTVSCVPPTKVECIATSTTSATIDFGTAATYEIVADTAEIYFEDIEMSIIDSTFTGSTFTLNASMLEDNNFAGKTFHVAARKVCSVEDMSEWTSEMTFTTPATAGQALPYTDDFEGYISGEATNLGYAILDSAGNYSEIAKTATVFPAVAKRSGYTLNHTIGGEFGLTTAQMNGTTCMAYTISNEFSWYKYFALEAGKTYEYSLYANVESKSKEYDIDIVYGKAANFKSMTVVKSEYLNINDFQEVTAIFTVPEDGDYFVGVHTQAHKAGDIYMPIIDDVLFAEVIVDTVINDTICGGEGYVKDSFNIAASDIKEGDNTFKKRAAGISGAPDSLRILNLYAYPVIAPTAETLVFCDNELPQEWATLTVGQYDTTMTYKSSFGCDSVVTYSITINPSYLIEEDDITIKSGASYVWHGQTITAAGTYTDIQKTAEGCDSIYTVKVTVESGIENISEINMNIIPNPTKAGAMAMVYGEFGDVVRVEILNNLGQIVDAFVPETSPIEVRGIETEGIYFVRVVTTDNSYVQKLIVK